MKEYPHLTEMGVRHPGEIEKFSLSGLETVDVLRIVYRRRPGSLLPTSRIYKFPRVQKTRTIEPGTDKTATVLETEPALRAAIAELEGLLETNLQKQDVAKSILEELQSLEEDIAQRAECIRQLAKRI